MRKMPFPFRREVALFDRSAREVIQQALESKRGPLLGQENSLEYRHGEQWESIRSDGSKDVSKFGLHSTELKLSKANILENDVSAILVSMTEIVNEMHKTFMKLMFEAVDRVTNETGNVVDRSLLKSNAEAFLELLKKVEFSVDREGNPSLPSLHVGAEQGKKLIAELESQGPEFKAEVEKIQQEKIQEALAREADRKARFKKTGTI